MAAEAVVEVSMGEEAAVSMAVEALAAVGTMVAGAASGDTTGVGTAVITAEDMATAAGALGDRAARSAGYEAVVLRCGVRRHRDLGHLTEAEASTAARRDGIRFSEEAMQEACPQDLAAPEWRAGLA